MRLARLIAALMVLGGCDDAAHRQGTGVPRADEDPAMAVKAANGAKDKAMIARDPVQLADFYTDDYLLIDQEAKTHDKRDQVQFMTQNVELLTGVSDDVKVTMLSPDTALVTGRMRGRYRMAGKESDFVERYTGIWLRQGQEWRVKHEHGSTAPDTE